jgi:ABC-type phosphate transport system substrate-binding protein
LSALDDIFNELNKIIDNREVATAVVTAAALAVAGGLVRFVDRVLVHRKRLRVTTDFDQVVNYKDQNLSIALADGSAAVDSIAILRFANAGTEKIELDSPDNDRFRIYFSGRTARAIKVRDPELSEGLTRSGGKALESALADLNELRGLFEPDTVGIDEDAKRIVIPNGVVLDRGQSFQLAVFLSGDSHAVEEKVLVRGRLRSGKILPNRSKLRRRVVAAATAAAMVAATIALVAANKAVTQNPDCIGDAKLNIQGSTAFAHVIAEAAADYHQQCPALDIHLEADGSDQVIADHSAAGSPLPADTIAMVDSSGQQVPAGWTANHVGMVIFGVVANNRFPATVAGTVWSPQEVKDWAGQEVESYPKDTLASIYSTAAAGHAPYVAVGRSANSGTASAFDSWLGLGAGLLNNAATCGSTSSTITNDNGAATASGLCSVGTTQEMLAYVNANPNAIGFAELDAVSQYPYLTVLAVGGALPDRTDVLNGSYAFAVPEVLYTAKNTSSQVTHFLTFLQSTSETAELAALDAGFIPCADLSGAVAGDCS